MPAYTQAQKQAIMAKAKKYSYVNDIIEPIIQYILEGPGTKWYGKEITKEYFDEWISKQSDQRLKGSSGKPPVIEQLSLILQGWDYTSSDEPDALSKEYLSIPLSAENPADIATAARITAMQIHFDPNRVALMLDERKKEQEKIKTKEQPVKPQEGKRHAFLPGGNPTTTPLPTPITQQAIQAKTATPPNVVVILADIKNSLPPLPAQKKKRSLEEGKIFTQHAAVDFLMRPNITDENLMDLIKTAKSDKAEGTFSRGLQRFKTATQSVSLADLKEVGALAQAMNTNKNPQSVSDLKEKLEKIQKTNPPTSKLGALCTQMLDVVKQVEQAYVKAEPNRPKHQ